MKSDARVVLSGHLLHRNIYHRNIFTRVKSNNLNMATAPTKPIQANETILGYTIKYSIGAGGYGEVWAAEAPGGLIKAVKFIYGFHNETRAQRELKALDRIKQLRHPFLISLERIEIVDGRLVIISELADTCLREHFTTFRDKGEQGIPRDLLLGYLGNVAEALDYISEEHSLQHLDIKPENLLLVGSHVKVADFGLVKSVHEANQQSMMESLTPTYAAPELFDGRPNRNSDQYSLAIVYQELLTGIRPFTGKTTAQLASQHIGSRPNLTSLAVSDRTVIARALAKDPEKRYPSCRSMIHDLLRRKSVTKSRPVRGNVKLERFDTNVVTQDVNAIYNDQTDKLDTPSLKCEQPEYVEIEKLRSLKVDVAQAFVRPTVFIGLGQAAGTILARIKGQIASRIGTEQSTPAIKFLYLDTDRSALYESTADSTNDGRLESGEILEMPLRSREEYRNCKKDFSWLSRRWLFNVPRSLQTEGLRPLGRLALADHFDSVYRRMADLIESANQLESLSETAETLGMGMHPDEPQIFIVASVSGGVGSGTALDITQSVRTIFEEQGITNGHIYGVFTHSTKQCFSTQQLSLANTYTFLCEYNHYCLSGYKGDKTIDLPSFESGAMFSSMYFLNLGESIDEVDYDEKLRSIANYLFLNTASKCSLFFDQCRREDDGDSSGLMLRSFWLSNAVGGAGRVVNQMVRSLAERLIEYWKHRCGFDKVPALNHLAAQMLADIGFEPDRLVQTWRSVEQSACKVAIKRRVDEQAHTVFAELSSETEDPAQLARQFIANIQNVILGNDSDDADSLVATFLQHVDTVAQPMHDELARRCGLLINEPGIRLAGASIVAASMVDDLQQHQQRLEQLSLDLNQGLQTSSEQFLELFEKKHLHNLDIDSFERAVDEISAVLSRIAYNRASVELARVLIRNLKSLSEQFDDMCQQLVLVNEVLQETCGASLVGTAEMDRGNDLIGDKIIDTVQSEFDKMVTVADVQFNQRELRGYNGLYDMVNDRAAGFRQLPGHLKAICQLLIIDCLHKFDLDQLLLDSQLDKTKLNSWIDDKLKLARPLTRNCGGAARLMIGVPELSSNTKFIEALSQGADYEPTVIKGLHGDCVFSFEVRDIPLDNLAVSLIEPHTGCKELIHRLHVRADIDWTNLTQFA